MQPKSSPPIAAEAVERLPDWALKRCGDCGELFLPEFGSQWWSKRPDCWTHGGLSRCREQAEFLEHHPGAAVLMATVMHQALVEAEEVAQRFISEADDENWNDEVAQAMFAVLSATEHGRKVRDRIRATSDRSNLPGDDGGGGGKENSLVPKAEDSPRA